MISIIIPTHNKCEDVQRCLSEVLAHAATHGDAEVIVIDDGSTDGTEARLRDSEGVPFTYCRLPGNGPARARNEGIARAQGDIVIMVDDDAIPQPAWLDAILAPFSDTEVVGVEGKVVPVGGQGWGPLGTSPRNLSGGVYLTCNIAYRRDALLAVGGFDEGFPFPAFEDTDLAMQMKKLGRIAWAPDALVHHPRRKWSFRRAIYEIRFNEALTRFALRYRCLGWTDRPARSPFLAVAYSAVIALPLGRTLRGLRSFPNRPGPALHYTCIAACQGMVAAFLVWLAIRKARANMGQRLTSIAARDTRDDRAGASETPSRDH